MNRGPRQSCPARGSLNLVVALEAEAQPLVEAFGLTAVPDGGTFSLYINAAANIRLTVSAIGKVASAAATSALQQRGEPVSAWLNVGTAGHRKMGVGEIVLAHKITDSATDRSWYPPLVFDPPCPTGSVRTVDQSITFYPTDDLYEMEAAGFYAAASRFATHELIHCVKVTSGNAEAPMNGMGRPCVDGLIRARLEPLMELAGILVDLSAREADRAKRPPQFGLFIERWHFTETQRHQLSRLLQQWSTLLPDADPLASVSVGGRNARAVLDELRDGLRECPLRLNQR